MGFHEVAPYLYLSPSRAPSSIHGFWVNKDAWAKLSPDLQAIVEYVTRLEPQMNLTEKALEDHDALSKYLDYGTEVSPLPKQIEEEFLRVAEEYFDEKSAADPFYAEVIESQRDFKAICELQNIR